MLPYTQEYKNMHVYMYVYRQYRDLTFEILGIILWNQSIKIGV